MHNMFPCVVRMKRKAGQLQLTGNILAMKRKWQLRENVSCGFAAPAHKR